MSKEEIDQLAAEQHAAFITQLITKVEQE